MIVNLQKVFDSIKEGVCSSFFNESGVFKYLKGEEKIFFDYELFLKEHSNVAFNKKTATINDFIFYTFNSNEFLGGGVLVINQLTGQTAVAYSINLSGNHHHDVITSKNFVVFEELFRENNSYYLNLVKIGFKGMVDSSKEEVIVASQFFEHLLSYAKNTSKVLGLCFSVIHQLTGFEKEISEDLLNYLKGNINAFKITTKPGHYSGNYSFFYNFPLESDLAKKAILNYLVVYFLERIRVNKSTEYFSLNLKEVIPSLEGLLLEELKPLFEEIMKYGFHDNDIKKRIAGFVEEVPF